MQPSSKNPVKEQITVDKEYFDNLVDECVFLSCLRNAGVNNWKGWFFACKEYEEIAEEQISDKLLRKNKVFNIV